MMMIAVLIVTAASLGHNSLAEIARDFRLELSKLLDCLYRYQLYNQ